MIKNCSGMLIIEDRTIDEFRCPKCQQRCCILCEKIHLQNEICENSEDYRFKRVIYIKNDDFYGWWANLEVHHPYSNQVSAIKVEKNSDEWNRVISHIEDDKRNHIQRVERIQHPKAWNKYKKYCDGLTRSGKPVREMCVWHGTRQTAPKIIYEGVGFDKNKARVGGCLWFAISNTYSMNGFQYVDPSNSENQVFLAFVACGDTNDVKFIRDDTILNVYCNEATYPAYVLTWGGGIVNNIFPMPSVVPFFKREDKKRNRFKKRR